jgi:hypothetical protein
MAVMGSTRVTRYGPVPTGASEYFSAPSASRYAFGQIGSTMAMYSIAAGNTLASVTRTVRSSSFWAPSRNT